MEVPEAPYLNKNKSSHAGLVGCVTPQHPVITTVVAVEVSDLIVFVGFHGQGRFPIVAISKGDGFQQGIPEIVSGGVIGANGSTGAQPFVEVPFAFGVYLRRPAKGLPTKRAAWLFRFSINRKQGMLLS
jgi:hypothetical protein